MAKIWFMFYIVSFSMSSVSGPRGYKGMRGSDGRDGYPGIIGLSGLRGKQGPPGELGRPGFKLDGEDAHPGKHKTCIGQVLRDIKVCEVVMVRNVTLVL